MFSNRELKKKKHLYFSLINTVECHSQNLLVENYIQPPQKKDPLQLK